MPPIRARQTAQAAAQTSATPPASERKRWIGARPIGAPRVWGKSARARHAALVFLLLFATLLMHAPLRAQVGGEDAPTHLFVADVNSDNFPQVEVLFYATDRNGLPVANLQTSNLIVAEDGQELETARLSLRPENGGGQSIVILLDTTTTPEAWNSIVASVQALLAQLQPGDAAALVTFADTVQVQAGLTTDLDMIRAALALAGPAGTQALVNQALVDALTLFTSGAAQNPDLAAHRQSIVLLTERAVATDAQPAETQPDALTVTQFAQQQGVSLILHAYGAAAGGADDLRVLAQNSGGRFVPLSNAGDAAASLTAQPSLLRQGYLLTYDSLLTANDSEHFLLLAGANTPPVERTFSAVSRPMEIVITRPANGATVSGNVVIAVSTSAPAPIQSITFGLDAGTIITRTQGAVGGILWDSAAIQPGKHQIVVSATDQAGNRGEARVDVTVRAPILLDVEMSRDSVQIGEPVVITTTVDSAVDGVIVEAFVGRTQVGVHSNPVGPVVFAVDTSTFAPGRYGLVVRATNSAGYVASNNSQVLTMAPVPAEPSQLARALTTGQALFQRWWLPALLLLIGLLLLWWLLTAIASALRRRAAAVEARALQVHPQMRILLMNSGNVRTRYRLRAQPAAGEYKFTFIHNGVMLTAPPVEHVAHPTASTAQPPVANSAAVITQSSAYAPTTYVSTAEPQAATVADSKRTADAQQAVEAGKQVVAQAGAAASFAGRFLNTAAELMPGTWGAQARRASGAVRKQQTVVNTARQAATEKAGDVQDLSNMSRRAASKAGSVAGSAQPTNGNGYPAPASQPSYRAAPTSAVPPAIPPAFATSPTRASRQDAAFTLQTTADGGVGGVPITQPKWVETPWVAPGETIGIDLFVEPLRGRARRRRVSFRLMTVPSEADGAQPSVDDVNIQLP